MLEEPDGLERARDAQLDDLVRRQPAESRPSRRILPLVALVIPVIRLKSVVLPDPFGPMTLTSSPWLTGRSRFPMTLRPPNASETPRSASRGSSAIR